MNDVSSIWNAGKHLDAATPQYRKLKKTARVIAPQHTLFFTYWIWTPLIRECE